MSDPSPRPLRQRKEDALALLGRQRSDVWVASASSDGLPHLVPLSLGWDGARVSVVTERESVTARNLMSSGRARLAVGTTRDVVMVDAALEEALPVNEVPAALVDGYVSQVGWDPRGAYMDRIFLVLKPERIQAWRTAGEIPERTVMRQGSWVI